MSGRKVAPPIDDDCECVDSSGSNGVDVTVIRTNDGKKSRVSGGEPSSWMRLR